MNNPIKNYELNILKCRSCDYQSVRARVKNDSVTICHVHMYCLPVLMSLLTFGATLINVIHFMTIIRLTVINSSQFHMLITGRNQAVTC